LVTGGRKKGYKRFWGKGKKDHCRTGPFPLGCTGKGEEYRKKKKTRKKSSLKNFSGGILKPITFSQKRKRMKKKKKNSEKGRHDPWGREKKKQQSTGNL